jgi:hypothetical protein
VTNRSTRLTTRVASAPCPLAPLPRTTTKARPKLGPSSRGGGKAGLRPRKNTGRMNLVVLQASDRQDRPDGVRRLRVCESAAHVPRGLRVTGDAEPNVLQRGGAPRGRYPAAAPPVPPLPAIPALPGDRPGAPAAPAAARGAPPPGTPVLHVRAPGQAGDAALQRRAPRPRPAPRSALRPSALAPAAGAAPAPAPAAPLPNALRAQRRQLQRVRADDDAAATPAAARLPLREPELLELPRARRTRLRLPRLGQQRQRQPPERRQQQQPQRRERLVPRERLRRERLRRRSRGGQPKEGPAQADVLPALELRVQVRHRILVRRSPPVPTTRTRSPLAFSTHAPTPAPKLAPGFCTWPIRRYFEAVRAAPLLAPAAS